MNHHNDPYYPVNIPPYQQPHEASLNFQQAQYPQFEENYHVAVQPYVANNFHNPELQFYPQNPYEHAPGFPQQQPAVVNHNAVFHGLHFNAHCPIHQIPITHLCKAPNCKTRLLCEACAGDHLIQSYDHHSSTVLYKDFLGDSTLNELNQLSQEEHALSEPLDPKYPDVCSTIQDAFKDLKARVDELMNQAEEKALQRVKEHFLLKKDTTLWEVLKVDYLTARDIYLASVVGVPSHALENFIQVLNLIERKKKEKAQDLEATLKHEKEQMDKFLLRLKENIPLLTDNLFSNKEEDDQKLSLLINPESITFKTKVKGDHKYIFNAMTFIPKLDQFVSTSEGGTITTWNPTTFAPITTYKVHNDKINSIVYVDKENLLVTGSQDKSIRLFPVTSHDINIKKPEIFTSHTAPVRSLLVLEGEDRLASAGEDADIRIWNLKARNLDTIISTNGWKTSGDEMIFIRPERWIVAAGQGEIRIYDYIKRQFIMSQDVMKKMGSLYFLNDRRWLVAQDSKDRIQIWKLDSEKKKLRKEKALKLPNKAKKSVYFKCFDESDTLLVSGGSNKISAFDLASGKLVKEIETGLQKTTSITLLKNERRMVVGDAGSNMLGILHY